MTLLDLPEALVDAKIENYCVAKKCDADRGPGWHIAFHICICPSQDHLQKLNIQTDSRLRRCCPNSLFTNHNDQDIECPIDSRIDPGHHCSWDKFLKHNFFQVKGDKLEITELGTTDPSLVFDFNDPDYCIGPTWKAQLGEPHGLKQPVGASVFTCPDPCKGEKLCLR